jgi:hypothetical protein
MFYTKNERKVAIDYSFCFLKERALAGGIPH